MDTDPSFALATGQSGRQTTLDEIPALAVFLSWLRLPAHTRAAQSKADGPLSGSEDMTVEGVTLADYCEGRGEKSQTGGLENG